jgi:sugar-specific transcriptional regulator TrmB
MITELRQAGLTENESKVYVTLLDLGPSKANRVAQRSGLHRRVIYDTLDLLLRKGLANYIEENGVKVYAGANPNRVLEILQEKTSHVEDVLPELHEMFTESKQKEWTSFYKGKAGLKTVFEDQIETEEEILIIGANKLAYDVLSYYFKWFDEKRVKAKIPVKMIVHEKLGHNIPLSKIKHLPKKYASPLAINVYGDKVAIIMWDLEHPYAIVKTGKSFADAYRNHFEIMWDIAKE